MSKGTSSEQANDVVHAEAVDVEQYELPPVIFEEVEDHQAGFDTCFHVHSPEASVQSCLPAHVRLQASEPLKMCMRRHKSEGVNNGDKDKKGCMQAMQNNQACPGALRR